ncbi:hypothetical protein BJ508DRAFT_325043, partial [Ascobolus immersus RN42]
MCPILFSEEIDYNTDSYRQDHSYEHHAPPAGLQTDHGRAYLAALEGSRQRNVAVEEDENMLDHDGLFFCEDAAGRIERMGGGRVESQHHHHHQHATEPQQQQQEQQLHLLPRHHEHQLHHLQTNPAKLLLQGPQQEEVCDRQLFIEKLKNGESPLWKPKSSASAYGSSNVSGGGDALVSLDSGNQRKNHNDRLGRPTFTTSFHDGPTVYDGHDEKEEEEEEEASDGSALHSGSFGLDPSSIQTHFRPPTPVPGADFDFRRRISNPLVDPSSLGHS